MTTIKLKNGSGAPTAGDLVQGEPALDLTNKRLYTEDSGGTVIEVGTNPTSITTGDITATGTVSFAGLGTTGDVTFGDNDKAIFGAGSDLQIYHDPSVGSIIQEAGAGSLFVRASTNIQLEGVNGENMAIFNENGSVQLYYDNAEKLATTSTGIDVTGNLTVDAGSNGKIEFGNITTNYGRLYADSTGTFVGSVTADPLILRTTNTERMRIDSSGNVGIGVTSPSGRVHADGDAYTAFIADGTSGGAFKFYKNGSQHAQIFSDGSGDIIFRNNSDSERMRIDSSGRLGLGTSSPAQKLTVVESSADFAALIKNDLTSGNGLRIQAGDNSGDRILQLEDKDANEKFRVTALGNVGINNTNPQAPLHANGDSAFGEAAIFQNNGDATSWARADWINDQASGTGIVYRDQAGTFVFRNDNSSGTAMNTQIVAGGSTAGNIVFRKDSTGTGEIAKFDASGNLLVGKTDNDNTTAGFKVQSGGFFSAVADGTTTCVLNRLSSDGDIAIFRKDGSTVGSIGSVGGASDLYIASNTFGVRFLDSDSAFIPSTSNGSTGGTGDLGSSSYKWRDLYLSGVSYNGDGSASAPSISFGADTNTGFYRVGSDQIGFVTAGSLKAKLDSSGNLLVGKTNNTLSNNGTIIRAGGELLVTNTSDTAGTFNRLSTDGAIVGFYKDGTTVGSVGTGGGSLDVHSSGASNVGLRFAQAVIPMLNGAVNDGNVDLGTSTRRFDDIYATNGTIQTSDRNEKQDIEELSDAEQRVAVACKGLLRKFRWKSAVEEKGDDARIHFGIIAQDLQDAFTAEGLDAGRYGMFINSTWTDEETGEERSRMGVRYSELLAFIISAI